MKRKFLKHTFSLFLCGSLCFSSFSTALASESLSHQSPCVQTSFLKANDFLITADMTPDEIQAALGAPKLITSSMLGGHAYAFYDGNYENYIYLETNSAEEIVAYGSIASGSLDYIDSRITPEIYETAYERFFNDAECRMGVARHAALIANAKWALAGKDIQKTFSEDTFYLMEQIHQQRNTGAHAFFSQIGQSGYYRPFSAGVSAHHGVSDLWFPNPLELTDSIEEINETELSAAFSDPVFSYYISDEGQILFESGFLDPAFFDAAHSIAYTKDEENALKRGRELYNASVSLWNSQPVYYEQTPQFRNTPLTAGSIHEDKLRASVLLINAIRAGAGLSELEYSPEISRSAQDKAVMVAHANANALTSGHLLPQHSGVSDELYQSGMKYQNENLYMCGITGGQLISSITYALDDGYGDPWFNGHRYNLLNPSFTSAGFGEAGGQAVHKFTGTQTTDVDMAAWPSKGVAALESIISKNMNWTIQFYKNYHVTDQTTVQVTLLNNSQTWKFSKADIPSSKITDKIRYAVFPHFDLLSFYNAEIPLARGNVFLIRVNGLTDDSGNACSYEYRTVCENFYGQTSVPSSGITDISADASSVCLRPDETRRISVSILPEDAANPLVLWTSEDAQTASVNQYGVVTAHALGTTVIRAKTLDGGYTVSISVTVTEDGQIALQNDPDSTPEQNSASPNTEQNNSGFAQNAGQNDSGSAHNAGQNDSGSVQDAKQDGSDSSQNQTPAQTSTPENPPETPVLKLKRLKNRKVKLSWKKINTAKVEIQYREGTKKYKKLKTVSGKKTAYTTKKLKKGKTYSFRIRASVTSGKIVYSLCSKAKKIKIR